MNDMLCEYEYYLYMCVVSGIVVDVLIDLSEEEEEEEEV
jgi:hypothetical protein